MASITSLSMLATECLHLVHQIEDAPETAPAVTTSPSNHIYDNIPKPLSTNSSQDNSVALVTSASSRIYENIPKSLSIEGKYNHLKEAWIQLSKKTATPEDTQISLITWSILQNIQVHLQLVKASRDTFHIIDLQSTKTQTRQQELDVKIPLPSKHSNPTQVLSLDEQLKAWVTRQTEIPFDQANTDVPFLHFLSNTYPSPIEVYNKTYISAQAAFDYLKGQKNDFASVAVMEHILHCKFEQDLNLKKMLINTGGLPLVFFNPVQGKNFWGINADSKGQNMLGILLVNLRKKFQNPYNLST